MKVIRVVINGALGRMGQEVAKAIASDCELSIAGAVEEQVTQQYLPLTGISESTIFFRFRRTFEDL